MKQGYYIYNVLEDFAAEGVLRKINMQVGEFEKVMPFTRINVNRGRLSTLQKLMRVLPFCRHFDYKKDIGKLEDPKVIYVRRSIIERGLIDFFKNIKKEYPDCLIILEMPVFPYFKDAFCHSVPHFIRNLPLWFKDTIYRKKLYRYVDYISTFSDEKEICKVPTLKIKNGIQVDKVAPLSPREDDGCLNIMSVAVMAVHHGFERFIEGMARYYENGGKRNVVYHVVGYGPEEEYYRSLVSKYGLGDRVIFYGKKTGEELDRIYEKTDMALASLGMYKINLKSGSFIKTGEYLAKGLPMITGCEVDVLDHSDFDYFIEFPNDASPIDIEKVIDFYDGLVSRGKEKMIADIRAYAYKKADMSVALSSVTDVMRSALSKDV